MFDSLKDKLQSVFTGLGRKGALSQADVDAGLSEVRKALLEADVALPVVRHFMAEMKEKACLLYTSPSPRDLSTSRMPSSA